MKKFCILFLIIVSAFASFAQNNIGIGTITPNASAALDITSTTKGLLTPRMTTTQRTAISTPAKGLLVYDTDLNALYHYNGAAWAAVGGSGGSFSLPYSGSIANAGDAFSITNTGNGSAISGTAAANSVAAVEGNSSATVGGYGVLGSSASATGFGVGGINATGTAVYGFSGGGGIALRGVSTSGYGLSTSGNLRLTGGNTNPAEGAVLTSVDALGNAVWKKSNVGFSATDAANTAIPNSTNRKVEFGTESFDNTNNFLPYAGATTTGSSVFTVPVSGLYHISSFLNYSVFSLTINFEDAGIYLIKNGETLAFSRGTPNKNSSYSWVSVSASGNFHLTVGDKIWVETYQVNSSASLQGLTGSNGTTNFSGHLIIAD